jgi:hypothetical protein
MKTIQFDPAIFRQEIQLPRVSDAEYELAVTLALADEPKNAHELIRLVTQKIEDPRDEVLTRTRPDHRVGSFIALPSGVWAAVYQESDREARARLLSNSESMRELTTLEQQAKDASDKAAKAQELESALKASLALPARAVAFQQKLATLAKYRADLDETLLNDRLADACDKWLDGNVAAFHDLNLALVNQATREIQLALITEREQKAKAELVALDEQNRQLSNKVGRSKHNFSK